MQGESVTGRLSSIYIICRLHACVRCLYGLRVSFKLHNKTSDYKLIALEPWALKAPGSLQDIIVISNMLGLYITRVRADGNAQSMFNGRGAGTPVGVVINAVAIFFIKSLDLETIIVLTSVIVNIRR